MTKISDTKNTTRSGISRRIFINGGAAATATILAAP